MTENGDVINFTQIPGAPPAGVPRLPPLADSATDEGAVGASSVTATRQRAADVAVDPAPGPDAPADSPDGARAGMVQEANPTIADEAHGPATSGGRRRKRKYAPGKTERLHRRWCSDSTVRAPLSDDAQAGGGGESGV